MLKRHIQHIASHSNIKRIRPRMEGKGTSRDLGPSLSSTSFVHIHIIYIHAHIISSYKLGLIMGWLDPTRGVRVGLEPNRVWSWFKQVRTRALRVRSRVNQNQTHLTRPGGYIRFFFSFLFLSEDFFKLHSLIVYSQRERECCFASISAAFLPSSYFTLVIITV